MQDFKPVIGIDLGTTFSAIAYIDEHDKPVVITNQEGKTTTPSVVHFYDEESHVVGDSAVNMLLADPKNTVSFVKRSMGDSDFSLKIYNRNHTPQVISAFILKKLKQDAESYFRNMGLDLEISDAVITVPAYFGMEQKGATKEAGELAGLNVLRIINEPTAAALAFGINKLGKDQTVFVFDLGGGTFDATILDIKGKKISMLASDGDAELGGKDWDDALVNHCSKLFIEKHGVDPQDDLYSYQELYDRVLRTKILLSTKPKDMINVSHEGNREIFEITRETFEDLTIDSISQCKYKCEEVLEKANMTWNDIDTVLLVGGSTYMPMIRNMIKEISSKEPSTDVNPDQCVAIGSAYEARFSYIENEVKKVEQQKGKDAAEIANRELRGSLPEIDWEESVAKSIGIIVLDENGDEVVQEMIKEQTFIPVSVEDEFGYAHDNQTSVKAEVTEGRGHIRDDVRVIGNVILENLPPRQKGTPIKVIYTYNKDKTLDIEVIDIDTGQNQEGKVVLEGSTPEEEKKISQDYIAKSKSK